MQAFDNAFGAEWLVRYRQWAEALLYSSFCFLLPFILSHSSQQLLLGTLVNAAIIIAAARLEWKHVLPVIVFPVLGVLSAGALFGSLTASLLLLALPIWAGNALLAFVFKRVEKADFAVRAILGAAMKSGLIGLSAFALLSFSLAPSALLIPMGAVQFVTALCGSAIAFFLLKALN
ncbi:MAG: hypothetical protein NT067_04090 [Candidatus Diapherotrites archaeon]|nr:hypothetical protein [Candidatus Diapherotrites archaeon]